MIALTLVVLLGGRVIGVLPNVEHFAYQQDCDARGEKLAKRVRRPVGARVRTFCENTYEIKA